MKAKDKIYLGVFTVLTVVALLQKNLLALLFLSLFALLFPFYLFSKK